MEPCWNSNPRPRTLEVGSRQGMEIEAAEGVTPVLPRNSKSGRGDWIRTSDRLRPRRVDGAQGSMMSPRLSLRRAKAACQSQRQPTPSIEEAYKTTMKYLRGKSRLDQRRVSVWQAAFSQSVAQN